MRMAFVSIMGRSAWGACEILWTQAARRALAQGHEVLISVYRWRDVPEAITELQRAGAIVDFRSRDGWTRRSALLARLSGAFRKLEEFAPQVVCLSQGGTYDIARGGSVRLLRAILLKRQLPYILLCHCEQPAPRHRRLQRARAAFQAAAMVGVLAEKLRAVSENHLGIPLPTARTFHNPVNLRNIALLPWPDEKVLSMAFVGRLEPVKNLSVLIGILSLPHWRERAWSLTVCGLGPLRDALEQQTQRAGLSDRIDFAGYVRDIDLLWKSHHVLIMPSQFEGVPLAMIEAMLCGRPVAATNVGGISEWLKDGYNGFLIGKPAAAELNSDLQRLWDKRDELMRMGQRAHESVIAQRDRDPAGTLVKWLQQAAHQRPPL